MQRYLNLWNPGSNWGDFDNDGTFTAIDSSAGITGEVMQSPGSNSTDFDNDGTFTAIDSSAGITGEVMQNPGSS